MPGEGSEAGLRAASPSRRVPLRHARREAGGRGRRGFATPHAQAPSPRRSPVLRPTPKLLRALTQSCSRISSSIFTASTLAARVFLVKYLAWASGEAVREQPRALSDPSSLCQPGPRSALPRPKAPSSPPYLVDGVPALRVLAQQVPCHDDAGDLRGAALLALGAQLPRHHVHQQLGAQQGLAAPAAQPQP